MQRNNASYIYGICIRNLIIEHLLCIILNLSSINMFNKSAGLIVFPFLLYFNQYVGIFEVRMYICHVHITVRD